MDRSRKGRGTVWRLVHGRCDATGTGSPASAAFPERRGRGSTATLGWLGRGGAAAEHSCPPSVGASPRPPCYQAQRRRAKRWLLCRRQARDAGCGYSHAVPPSTPGTPACQASRWLRWGLAARQGHRMRRAKRTNQCLPRGMARDPRRRLPPGFRDRTCSVGSALGRPGHRPGGAQPGRSGGAGLGAGDRPAP